MTEHVCIPLIGLGVLVGVSTLFGGLVAILGLAIISRGWR